MVKAPPVATMGITPSVTAPPSGHNGNYYNGDRWDTAPPSSHNRNYIQMETMTVTVPPSGHSGNYIDNVTAPPSGHSGNDNPSTSQRPPVATMRITLPTIATNETQRPPVATIGMTPYHVTAPPSGHNGNNTPPIYRAPQWPQWESHCQQW